MLRRLLLCLAATGAAFGISVAAAPGASATHDICASGEFERPIPVTVAEHCVPYPAGVGCTMVDAEEPFLTFFVQVCWPRPTEPTPAP